MKRATNNIGGTAMNQPLDNKALTQLFSGARSFNAWRSETISDVLLHQLYELMRWGPTAANSCPAPMGIVKREAEKQRIF
jgi:nitroreductase